MDYHQEHLDSQLDAHGDLAPPWVRYPTYTRYTIGWRMGAGEDWMCFAWAFLDRLGPERAVRVAYLRRHPPAPLTWADWILHVLGENDAWRDPDADALARLEAEGLIAPDAAFEVYRKGADAAAWPWEWSASPLHAARYCTRDLAFWSRNRQAGGRSAPSPVSVPEPWAAFARVVASGSVPGSLPHARGLDALALFLAAGWPPAPWSLGLEVASAEGSVEEDAGYADAFGLWLACTFDDRRTFDAYASTQPPAPREWTGWIDEVVRVP